MTDRIIYHIDMNAFYASVAQMMDPSLRGKPVAVAGDPEKRNGIILAKSRQAKEVGVKTAMAIWEAKRQCPSITIVPPDYHAYKRYSRLFREMCYEYTDLVEPFGLDELWMDVTNSLHLQHCSPYALAVRIADRIRCELGLTVSIGISWTKPFAKLGSDIDPGDGIIEITKENYEQVVWERPAGDLIYVGPATESKLAHSGYVTIGDIAHAGDYFLQKRFGKIGFYLRSFARGEDETPVREYDPVTADTEYDIKGIGNGLTAPHDLTTLGDVKALTWLLSESVAQRLRAARMRARTISIGIRKAKDLSGYTRQTTLDAPTCLTRDIANAAMNLICENQPLDPEHAIRAIHVRVTNLNAMDIPVQHDLFGDADEVHKMEKLDLTIDALRQRFGNACVRRMVELEDPSMAGLDIARDNTVHPIGYLR